jgi:hypothetical protein
MTPIQIFPESLQFHIDPQQAMAQVINQIGYPHLSSDRQTHGMIWEIVRQGDEKIQVNFAYKEARMMDWDGPSITADGIRISSMRWGELVRHMESPERVCCFVITLGTEFDRWLQQLQQQSMFDAFVADALGAVCIEFAADQLSMEFEKQYGRMDLECSRRLSPGYCDWRLDDGQKAIFQFLQPEHIGVSCQPTGLMVPLKTISAVIFIGKSVLWKTPCVFCNDRACRHRREELYKKEK